MRSRPSRRRRLRRARIAGILDCHGGLRVVCTDADSIYSNCSIMSPERLFLLPPSCWVKFDENDRIPWGMIPWTVRRVELYIAEWIRTRNDPDALKHVAIQRYVVRCAARAAGEEDGSLHIAGFLVPPRYVFNERGVTV